MYVRVLDPYRVHSKLYICIDRASANAFQTVRIYECIWVCEAHPYILVYLYFDWYMLTIYVDQGSHTRSAHRIDGNLMHVRCTRPDPRPYDVEV